jgi:hypothetical protein
MARVLLISSNMTEDPCGVYPLGVTLVAEAAREAGHEVLEWDCLQQGAPTRVPRNPLESFEPEIIGLSIRNIDNADSVKFDSYVNYYRGLMEDLREASDVPIVLGGAGYSLFAEELLDLLGADYGVQGEGERAFCHLVEELAQGFAPNRKIWTGSTFETGNQFGTPRRNPELTGCYLARGGMLNVQTKRGCPFHCAYCTYPLLEGPCYRFRPAGDVGDEIEALRDVYRADYIAFTDSVFNDTEGRYLEVAEELVRRNIQLPWMAFFRPGRFSASEVNLLVRSGLKSVEWGTDCSTDTTLEAMGKSFTWSEVEESNRLFASAGVACAHFVMFGGPDETPATVREGLDNLTRLERCVVLVSRGVRVLPSTRLHAIAMREGVLDTRHNLLDACFYYAPAVDPDFLHVEIQAAFNGHPDRVYPPGRDADNNNIQAFHQSGYQGPVWNSLLSPSRRPRRRDTA